jgi:3-mercaptopyruvate sulfurtransferase SseA
VASFLEKHGYRAYALQGGYMAWLRAGYPVERKEATAALPAAALCPECDQPLATHASETDE